MRRTYAFAPQFPWSIACWLALLVAISVAMADPLTPVQLRVNGKAVSLSTRPVSDGREVYIPLGALGAFKAQYRLTHREESAIVTFATGEEVEIALARPGKEKMLPLSALLEHLKLEVRVENGICDVCPASSSEERQAREDKTPKETKPPKPPSQATPTTPANKQSPSEATPRSAEAHPEPAAKPAGQPPVAKASPKATDKFSAEVRAMPQKSEPIATEPPPPPKTEPRYQRPQEAQKKTGSEESAAKAPKNPPSETTLTLTLPPARPPKQPAKEAPAAGTPLSDPLNQAVQSAERVDAVKILPSRGGTNMMPRAGLVRIQDVQFHVIDNNHAQLKITSDGKLSPTATLLRDPSRLAIDLPNATLEVAEHEWAVEHPFVNHIRLLESDKPGTSRIEMHLRRLIGYQLVSVGPTGFTVNLSLPRGAGRRMKDLIVVVDPGHGGRNSPGCSVVVNGVCIYEKNLTLSIATKLQKLLTTAGVKVLMTRTEDVDVPLKARPALATDNNADLFVSIHIDSCPIPNSASGSTTYYHKNDPSSRALAQSIVERIGQVSGLPVRGAKSDGVLYTNGLAVLRNSTVPAVLIEVGYINNVKDRQKLLNEEFQQRVAQAIVAGIRGYVEGVLPEDPLVEVNEN